MGKYALLVHTNAAQGRDDEFNEWYDNVHLGEVLEVEGFTAAQRFALQDPNAPADARRYLAIYEMETDDPQATLAALGAAAPNMQMSDALAADSASITVWAPLGDRVSSSG